MMTMAPENAFSKIETLSLNTRRFLLPLSDLRVSLILILILSLSLDDVIRQLSSFLHLELYFMHRLITQILRLGGRFVPVN